MICLKIIAMTWHIVWKKLYPETNFDRLKPEAAVMEETASINRCMGLHLDEGDINELIKKHSKELTLEAAMRGEMEEEDVISTNAIKERLGM